MDLPTVWQLGTGDSSRTYAQWLFDNGVAAIGPSSGGRWPGSGGHEYQSSVHAFAEDARRGDLVIAKRGLRTILGIGVLGAYDFDADIDTEGWDLSHIRRTRWIVKKGGLV